MLSGGGYNVFKIAAGSFSSKDTACAQALKDVKNALIISAYNLYIFPEEVVNTNTIINYHNALLPWHRGLNGTAWAIWANDAHAGMSWHKVETSIDTGAILVQPSVDIDETTDSLSLSNQLNRLAIESLPQAIENLIKGITLEPSRCVEDDLHAYHNAKALPNQGIFERNWDLATASRFLRAMYAAKMKFMPAPSIEIDGELHTFLKWKLKGSELTIKTTDGHSTTISYE